MSEQQANNFDFWVASRENRFLSDSLEKWIEISNSEQFNKIVKLLKDNKVIDLSANSFSSLSPDGQWISIRRLNNNTVNVYWLYESNISIIKKASQNLWYVVWWTIKNGEIFQESSLTVSYSNLSDRYLRDTNNLSEKVLEQVEKIRQDSKKRIESIKKDYEESQDKDYIISRGDSLWKIVKEKYDLNDNTQIANAINALVQHNKDMKWIRKDQKPADGIFWDTIIVWKTLKLPASLKIHGGITLERKR